MCRSVWQTPLASIRTSTSPGAGGSSSSSATRDGPACVRTAPRSMTRPGRPRSSRRASASVRSVSAMRCRIDGLDAFLAADGEPVGVRAPEQDRVGAQRERLQHVRAAADASVHQHDRSSTDRAAHLDERVERGHRRRPPGGRRGSRRRRRRRRARSASRASSPASTPFTSSGSLVCPRSQSRSSHVEVHVRERREHRGRRGQHVLLGRPLEPAAEDRVGEELRAALAGEEGQVGLAQVALPPTEHRRVEVTTTAPYPAASARSTRLAATSRSLTQ